MKIRIGIAGYGNLGRGVESAVSASNDMELAALFTRRDPFGIQTKTGVPVYSMNQAPELKDQIDVMDPGLYSLSRAIGQAVLPDGKDYTFWGRGVSQGHSDAIRRIEGVRDARQYTIPVESALERVRRGENPELTTREKHTRECFVVAEENADLSAIENAIKTMPNYFADYDTTVHFISEEELLRDHGGIPHGGMVFRCGTTGFQHDNRHIIEYRLQLDSNPEFTSSVLVAYARAAYRLNREGISGCKTVLDIAPVYLHPASPEELRRNLL